MSDRVRLSSAQSPIRLRWRAWPGPIRRRAQPPRHPAQELSRLAAISWPLTPSRSGFGPPPRHSQPTPSALPLESSAPPWRASHRLCLRIVVDQLGGVAFGIGAVRLPQIVGDAALATYPPGGRQISRQSLLERGMGKLVAPVGEGGGVVGGRRESWCICLSRRRGRGGR